MKDESIDRKTFIEDDILTSVNGDLKFLQYAKNRELELDNEYRNSIYGGFETAARGWKRAAITSLAYLGVKKAIELFTRTVPEYDTNTGLNIIDGIAGAIAIYGGLINLVNLLLKTDTVDERKNLKNAKKTIEETVEKIANTNYFEEAEKKYEEYLADNHRANDD